MPNSTTASRSGKARPPKPRKDFPLTPHPAGYWCKSINGKLKYFTRWGRRRKGKMEILPDGGAWKEALDEYERTKTDLYAGRTPRPKGDGLTLKALCNRFLTAKQHLLDNGEIVPRTFHDYRRITDRLIGAFGANRLVEDLAADDFEQLRKEIAATCGPVRLGGEIQQTRMVFKYGYDAGLIAQPIRYGPTFKRPSKRVLRKHRNSNGPRMFEAHEIRQLLDAAGVQLKAMILLAANCGYGNSDCGTLPLAALDLKKGWVNYPRPKTGVSRRCPLWPESVEALKAAIAERPSPKNEDDRGLVFITKYGTRWSKDSSANPISAEFRKLCQSLGIYRKGLGYYGLRHGFETIGGESRDQIAVDHVMGHARDDMASVYRERISDERLIAVVTHVRQWLFGETEWRPIFSENTIGQKGGQAV